MQNPSWIKKSVSVYTQKTGRSFATMVKDHKYGPIEQDSSLAIQQTLVLGNPHKNFKWIFSVL
jgi:hypothetical protein